MSIDFPWVTRLISADIPCLNPLPRAVRTNSSPNYGASVSPGCATPLANSTKSTHLFGLVRSWRSVSTVREIVTILSILGSWNLTRRQTGWRRSRCHPSYTPSRRLSTAQSLGFFIPTWILLRPYSRLCCEFSQMFSELPSLLSLIPCPQFLHLIPIVISSIPFCVPCYLVRNMGPELSRRDRGVVRLEQISPFSPAASFSSRNKFFAKRAT
ncbi:hypothetical protein F5Y07DRAFT_240127 [Xylaria sp. FL0933]|nr:hypothetical protein F5Y07DRAFT_240127 [Xylaria sp. FL0933]